MTRDLSRETLEASKRCLADGLSRNVPGGTPPGPVGILSVPAVGPGLLPLIHGRDENVFRGSIQATEICGLPARY